MKILIVFLSLFVGFSAHSADLIYFGGEEKGERSFMILNSESIDQFRYDESDQEAQVVIRKFKSTFKVESFEKAMEIFNRLRDKSDSSLIEVSN